MIYVENKKRKIERIQAEHPLAVILDITSSSPYRYGQVLSPFFPHGNIPIPGDSHGMTAKCVEGIWQGLKIFEGSGIDLNMFQNDTMKNIKRTARKFGKPLGHKYGVYSSVLLNYADARRYIYIPTYRWVLDNIPEVHNIIERIKSKSETNDIVLLDYNVNPDNKDISKPLSHAELVKMYIENRYPSKEEDFIPYTPEEIKRMRDEKKKKNRRVITSQEDKERVLLDITHLLMKSERSAKEIIKLLSLDIDIKDMHALLEKIPHIKKRKEKRTLYYTLGSEKTNPTLF